MLDDYFNGLPVVRLTKIPSTVWGGLYLLILPSAKYYEVAGEIQVYDLSMVMVLDRLVEFVIS
jgi:hypothetical protein